MTLTPLLLFQGHTAEGGGLEADSNMSKIIIVPVHVYQIGHLLSQEQSWGI